MSNSPKEITPNANKINVLAAKSAGREITPSQGSLALGIWNPRPKYGCSILTPMGKEVRTILERQRNEAR